jgi:hypothetical protein
MSSCGFGFIRTGAPISSLVLSSSLGFAMVEPPEFASHSTDLKYTKYFSAYGSFLVAWLFYEQVVEILLQKELRLDTREISILSSAMNFGVKLNTLKALMRRDATKQQGIEILGQIQAAAERNNVVHGFLLLKEGAINLVTRDVKNGKYIVKSRAHDSSAHMEQFVNTLERLQSWAGITDDEIDQYGREIEYDAKAHQDPDDSHPESLANSGQSTLGSSSILPQLGE